MQGQAVYSFRVGLSPGRPIVPDARHAFAVVAEEDSTAGMVRAGVVAAQMTHVVTGCAMVTSTELLEVEL